MEESRRRRSSAGERAEPSLDDSGDVEIGDLLHCLDSATVDLVHHSLPSEVLSRSHLPSQKETVPFQSTKHARALASPALKSDALNVAVYVHRVVGRGDEASSAHAAAAVKALDGALERLDEEMKKAAMFSQGERLGYENDTEIKHRRRHSSFFEGDAGRRSGENEDVRRHAHGGVPALPALLRLLGSDGEKGEGRRLRGEELREKEEQVLLALLHDSDEEKEEERGEKRQLEGDCGLVADALDGTSFIEQVKEEIQDICRESKQLHTEADRMYQSVEEEILVASRLLLLQEVVRESLHFVSTFKRLLKEESPSAKAALVKKLLALLREPHRLSASCSAAVCTPGDERGTQTVAPSAGETEKVVALGDLQSLSHCVSLVQREAAHLRNAARQQLLQAVEQGSSLSLASALDVFFLLDQLWEQVEAVLRTLVAGVCTPVATQTLQNEASRGAVSACTRVGKGSLPALLCRSDFESSLAAETESFFSRLEEGLKRASLVDQVLAVGEDPVTRQPYTAFLVASGFASTLSDELWRASSLHFSAVLRQVGAFGPLPPSLLAALASAVSQRTQRRRRGPARASEERQGSTEEGEENRERRDTGDNEEEKEEEEKREEREAELSRFAASLAPPQRALVEATPLLSFLLLAFLRRCEEISRAGVLSKAPSESQTGVLLGTISPLRQVYIHLLAARLDGVLSSLFSTKSFSQVRLFLRRLPSAFPLSLLLPPVGSTASGSSSGEEETCREAFSRLLQAVDPVVRLPASPDIDALVSAAFGELERARVSTDAELTRQAADVVEETLESLVLLCLCQLHRDVELEPPVLVDASGKQLLRRLPAASAARVRVSKVFALFAGVEAAMKTVLEENPHFLPLLQAPSEERSERGSFSFDESLRGFQASPCVSGEFFGDAEEAEHALFLERLYSQKPSLLQWNTFREVAAVKRRLLAPLFSSVERAAVDGCLQRIVEELPASLSSPGSKAADTRERTAARGEMAATEDVEQLHALCELERLLCHVQQQYLCLLPPASLVAPLSSLSLAVLETLLSLACVCEAGDERARAFVAAVVARGEVLLSAFWTDFHKHVRVGSDMLRNVRRLLFADSPFLLHEVLTLLPQQEPWLCSENGTFSSSSSASSSSCLSSPASLVTSSLPPLLVAVHLLYRLPAQSHSQQSPAGPPACLRLPGGAPELARRLSAYLRRERREPYGEGEEELETEHEETVQKLRRDLRHVVTLWGKGEESKESTGDGREGEERRERRKARGWMHRDREEEKREDLKLLTQVARLLNAAVNGGREVAEGNAREIVSSAHEAPEKSTPASSLEQTPLSAENAVPVNPTPFSSSASPPSPFSASPCSSSAPALSSSSSLSSSLPSLSVQAGEAAQEQKAGARLPGFPKVHSNSLQSPSLSLNGVGEPQNSWGHTMGDREDPKAAQVPALGASPYLGWEAEKEREQEPHARTESSVPGHPPPPPCL
ncbi:hypothetical protein TGVAND_251730 [Toxoplasma gondii VAND]|uniref:Conserved oligomeric Golgi complex subunit 5 helical domain-containing protein n=1 Tax=Toxoplasma gondii VAND TaxID=933077 RepID=A0A086Q9A2_TOXGO|nr:hypothetical protein TGVAND_251730 [Toxoplasma gondii VAND]